MGCTSVKGSAKKDFFFQLSLSIIIYTIHIHTHKHTNLQVARLVFTDVVVMRELSHCTCLLYQMESFSNESRMLGCFDCIVVSFHVRRIDRHTQVFDMNLMWECLATFQRSRVARFHCSYKPYSTCKNYWSACNCIHHSYEPTSKIVIQIIVRVLCTYDYFLLLFF